MKLLAVFLPCVLLCISAQLIESPPKVQLFLLQLRVRLLTNKLYEKCPDLIVDEGFLRDKSGDSLTVEQNIEIEQQIYEHVQELMMQCNQGNSTTSRPPTTSAPLPSQCTSSSTVNLKESWRNNYPLSNGQNRDGHGSASPVLLGTLSRTPAPISTAADLRMERTGPTVHCLREWVRRSASPSMRA